ncbi:MAG TPA: hypothetical protein VFH54_16965 [Mycobacteriales bacterium]|nr:hypothetical protein [Mycobacteriales bacterium]
MSSTNGLDEQERIARDRLTEVIAHLKVLSADADEQNAWLHPCGWTRHEPFVHDAKHAPCSPTAELWQSLDDIWPGWRAVLQPLLNPDLEVALDALPSRFEAFDEAAFSDDLETLDRPEWEEVRVSLSRHCEWPSRS